MMKPIEVKLTNAEIAAAKAEARIIRKGAERRDLPTEFLGEAWVFMIHWAFLKYVALHTDLTVAGGLPYIGPAERFPVHFVLHRGDERIEVDLRPVSEKQLASYPFVDWSEWRRQHIRQFTVIAVVRDSHVTFRGAAKAEDLLAAMEPHPESDYRTRLNVFRLETLHELLR